MCMCMYVFKNASSLGSYYKLNIVCCERVRDLGRKIYRKARVSDNACVINPWFNMTVLSSCYAAPTAEDNRKKMYEDIDQSLWLKKKMP